MTDREPYNGQAPFQRHSDTSAAAATAISDRIGPLHRRILDYLAVNPGGATDEMLGDELGLGGNTLRPRRRELQLKGRVEDSEKRLNTKSGRRAVVWKLAA